MDCRIQFCSQRQRHERMIDRVVVVGSRRAALDPVLLGMKISLHRIVSSRGSISVLGRAVDGDAAKLGKPGADCRERHRLGQKAANGSAAEETLLGAGGLLPLQRQLALLISEHPDAAAFATKCFASLGFDDQLE
jgi:hypothetical protein